MPRLRCSLLAAGILLCAGASAQIDPRAPLHLRKRAQRHFLVGIQCYNRRQYQEATEAWKAVLEIQPRHEKARDYMRRAARKYHLMLSHFYGGKEAFAAFDYPFAIQEFTQVLVINPHHGEARYYLALCYYRSHIEPFVPVEPGEADEIPVPEYMAKSPEEIDDSHPVFGRVTPLNRGVVRSNRATVTFQLKKTVTSLTMTFTATTATNGEFEGRKHRRAVSGPMLRSREVQSHTVDGLVSGNRYELSIASRDEIGRSHVMTNRDVGCDSEPPAVTDLISTSHPDGKTWYKNRLPTIAWRAEDAQSELAVHFLLSTNERETAAVILLDYVNENGTGAMDVYRCTNELSPGQWYAHALAVDAAGNTSPVTRISIRIEAPPPPEPAAKEEEPVGEGAALLPPPRVPPEPVYFRKGSAGFTFEGIVRLDWVLTRLRREPGLRMVIHGYSDDVGIPHMNLDLSLRRANNVWGHLVMLGVDPERLAVKAHGGIPPADDTDEAKAECRRVEFEEQFE